MVGHRITNTTIAAMFALLVGTNAKVQGQVSRVPSLQEFVGTPQYQANIGRLFATLPLDVFQRCPTLVSNGSSVTQLEPVSFGVDGHPIAGSWKQSFPVSGCGNDTTINFVFKVQPDARILSVVAASGDTHAGLLLQRDTVKFVMIAVGVKNKECSAPHLRTTTYNGSAQENTALRTAKGRALPWRETWTVSACGQYYRVPVTFIPDATGTTIQAAQATIVNQ